MPVRKEPLVTGNYYHIFNRTYQHYPFSDSRLCNRAIFSLWYSNIPHKISISNYLRMGKLLQQQFISNSISTIPKTNILAFCLMPNHFHLLLKQNFDGGISKFAADFQNTITQYFNKKNKTAGPLFQRQFKSVMIDNQEQLLHVSRYIHLNPFTSKLVHSFDELIMYPYSSLPIYADKVTDTHQIIDREMINNTFPTTTQHLAFINDQKEYQQTLHYLHAQFIDE